MKNLKDGWAIGTIQVPTSPIGGWGVTGYNAPVINPVQTDLEIPTIQPLPQNNYVTPINIPGGSGNYVNDFPIQKKVQTTETSIFPLIIIAVLAYLI